MAEGARASQASLTSSAADAAMDRYASGDASAFAELYDLLAGRLYAFLLRRTRDASRAEDLVQQTFLQMHCAREMYTTGGQVLPWAFCIARRLSVDAHRKAGREVHDAGEDDREAPESCPESALREKQAAVLFQKALEALPEPQRLAFELTKYDGLTHAEVADVLGTTVMAVKLRVHRTYEVLREASQSRGQAL